VQAAQKRRFKQVCALLVDLLPNVSGVRITKPTEALPQPAVRFKTQDGWVPLRWIGYGYRTLVAWMVDFASRMAEAYPHSRDPLAEPAVVLVDEIDLHMHPEWQRTLMARLSQKFPNTQFIVTAHSPLFGQAAAGANLAVLRRESPRGRVLIDNDVDAIRGWRIDQLLTSDLFGLPSGRPPAYDALLAERERLMTKPRLTAADRKRLDALERRADDLPSGATADEAETAMLLKRALNAIERPRGARK
jgi:hypothetical protein